MSDILRVVKQANWIRHESDLFEDTLEAPADTLNCLKTQNNELSVYRIDESRVSLDRLIAAYCANRDRIDNLDVVIFDREILAQADVSTEDTLGTLPDADVNALHLALKNLTAYKVAELANLIWLSPVRQVKRYFPQQVKELIASSIDQGYIQLGDLKPSIQDKFQNLRKTT